MRDEDTPSEYTIEAWKEGDGNVAIFANLRVREFDNPTRLELIGVEIGGMHTGTPGSTEMTFEVPVPVEEIRDLPYSQLIARAQLLLGGRGFGDALDLSIEDISFDELRKEWPKGDVDAVSRAVGVVYRLSIVDGQPAQKSVQKAFGVSRATAGRMISKARELGYIAVQGVTGRPRKGSDHGKKIPRSRGDR